MSCVIASIAITPLRAESAKEQPVGLILSAEGANLLRANSRLPLAARTGDVLFSGDSLRTTSSPATILFCPLKLSQGVAPNAEVTFQSNALQVKLGKLASSKPVGACFLPQLARVAVSSQQEYGVSMIRELPKTDIRPLERNRLPGNVLADLEPVERDIAADPVNPANWVAEAAVFEKYRLDANALATYRKVAAQWKEAAWVSARISDLEQSLASQTASASAARATSSEEGSPPEFIKISSPGALGTAVFADSSKLPRTGENPQRSLQTTSDRGCTWALDYPDPASVEVVFPHRVSGVGAEVEFASSKDPGLWMVFYDASHQRIGMFRGEESGTAKRFIGAKGSRQIKSVKFRTNGDTFSIKNVWVVDGVAHAGCSEQP